MRTVLFVITLLGPLLPSDTIQTWDFRPNCFPFTPVPAERYGRAQFIDFDNDGRLEIVSFTLQENMGTPPHFEIRDHRHDVRHRENYDPEVIIRRSAHFFDTDDDLQPEIFLPILRHDSLFMDVFNVDASVERLYRIFITHGWPRRKEGGGVHPWDPEIIHAYFVDVNADGRRELLTIVRVYHARVQRGVYLHSLPDGALISSYTIGGQPNQTFLDDFDHDGAPELILHTSTPSNGADVNGFSDSYSYLIWFELSPTIHTPKHVMLSTAENVESSAFYDNFSGDKDKEFLTITMANESNADAMLRIIDPAALHTLQTRQYDFPVETVTAFKSPEQHHVGMLLAKRNGRVALIRESLNVDSLFVWPEKLTELKAGPDIDGDGYPEILLQGTFHSVLFNHRFDLLATWPPSDYVAMRTSPSSGTEYILSEGIDTNGVYELKKNSYYWVHRHVIPIIGILLGSLFAFVFLFAVKEHTQHMNINRFIEHLVQSDSRAIAIVDKKLRVRNHNQQLLDWFGLHRHKRRKQPLLHDWLGDYPLIAETLRQWRDGYSYIRRDKLLALEMGGGLRKVRLIFEPVPRTLLSRRVFQVSFSDQSIEAELENVKRWQDVARRVTHDLKNPLGTIQLTLQKLRTLVTQGRNEDALFSCLDKIEERIESLRKMTRNFLKFVNLEAPRFAVVNVNEFLVKTIATIATTMPPDIQLMREITDKVTAVESDVEQMTSVLENLVANAINAMPNGGSITLSSRVAQRLQFPGYDERPRDYALIEIRDTGIGIAPDMLERLFEPKLFSKETSGLGLAMVKKIIDDHGGHIEVESDVDVGTLFSIYLPLKTSG